MKKLAIGLGIVLLMAAIAFPVFGRGLGWGPGSGSGSCIGQNYDSRHGRGMGGLERGYGLSSLNLTDEQNSRMKTLREANQKEVVPLRAELNVRHAELRALWAQINPDEDALLAKQKEINKLRDQIGEKRTKHRVEMRKILTPEQRTQLPLIRHGKGIGHRGGGYGDCPRQGEWNGHEYNKRDGYGFRGRR